MEDMIGCKVAVNHENAGNQFNFPVRALETSVQLGVDGATEDRVKKVLHPTCSLFHKPRKGTFVFHQNPCSADHPRGMIYFFLTMQVSK